MTSVHVPVDGSRLQVTVVRDVPSRDDRSPGLLRWRRSAGRVDIRHAFSPATISDDAMVGALVELVEAGALSGQRAFEEAATAIIDTSGDDDCDGWRAFYRNSVAELRAGTSAFSPVHRRARSLVVGRSVLEVGCCFGFLALQCAQDGHEVSACDISSGALALLADAAADFGVPVATMVGDARRLDLPDGHVDTVTLVHLLEHLDPDGVRCAIDEAVRVARRRVVIAVPFEEEPSPHFGHLQRLTEADLHAWAAPLSGIGARVFTDHGGWLVLDLI